MTDETPKHDYISREWCDAAAVDFIAQLSKAFAAGQIKDVSALTPVLASYLHSLAQVVAKAAIEASHKTMTGEKTVVLAHDERGQISEMLKYPVAINFD